MSDFMQMCNRLDNNFKPALFLLLALTAVLFSAALISIGCMLADAIRAYRK